VTGAGLGYVFYDPSLAATLSSDAGALLGPAWLLAHELGHNIQNAWGSQSAGATLDAELGADCLAGYFLSWLACAGQIDMGTVESTLMRVCSEAMAGGWFDASHGTCAQRVSSLSTGMDGYARRREFVPTCTFGP
jgi:predicted metalloprotease